MTSGRSESRAVDWITRRFTQLLRLTPHGFRGQFERQWTETFRSAVADAYRSRGWFGATRVWIGTLGDLFLRAPIEHLTPHPNRTSWSRRVQRTMMTALFQDLRFAIRMLRRHPGFAAISIITLALGIGANTAIFSVVRGVLLRPLPFGSPEQLVSASVWFRNVDTGAGRMLAASEPEYLELREQIRAVNGVAGYWAGSVNLGGLDEPQRVPAAGVSANFLDVLGVTPQRGRGFAPGEDEPDAPAVAVISHALWQGALGAPSDVIGHTLLVRGAPTTVIGVLPASFRFPGGEADILIQNIIDRANPSGRASHYLSMVGRLGPGLSLADARADAAQLFERWDREHPDEHRLSARHPVEFAGLREAIVGDVRTPLVMLLVAVGLVLLVACANIANVSLARAQARSREMGVRTAMGAGRARLFSQVLLESGMIAVLGGGLGLILAIVGVDLLVAAAPEQLPRLDAVRVDGVVLTFTALASLASGLLFGLAPAATAPRRDIAALFRDARATVGARALLVRRTLVVGQVGLAVMLIIGAGLMLKSFAHLRSVDPGFDATGVVTMDLTLNPAVYPEPSDVARFHAALAERVVALPSVTAAGAIRRLPIRIDAPLETLRLVGRVDGDEAATSNAQYQIAAPDYFRVFRVPLRQGRMLAATDGGDAPSVVLINETMARSVWPAGDAIGHRIQLGSYPGNPNPEMTIVGVVGDVRQAGLDAQHTPQFFVPRQQAGAIFDGAFTRASTFVARAEGDPLTTIDAIRAIVREMDPNLPLANVGTMETVVAESIADDRFTSTLLGVFSVVALLLGAVGVYGLMAFLVASQGRDMGIRIALGAHPRRLLNRVMWQGMHLTLVGVALGVVAALAASRVIESLVFDVSVRDPLVFTIAPTILVAAAIVACYLPGRRAAMVDPVVTLRAE